MSNGGTASIEVIVKLTQEAAAPDSPQHKAIDARAAQLGVSLAPLHPSTSDPDLASYAVAHVNPLEAEAVVDQLLRCNGVEGAYAKPPGAPPERSAQHVEQP